LTRQCYFSSEFAASLLLAIGGWLLTPHLVVTAQELNDRDKSRVGRLDKMAESMDEVDVAKKYASGDRQSDGRRQSEVSELKFRFLLSTSGLINDNKDGMLLIPMQISGFSSTISPGSKPQRKVGSDLVDIRVAFKGLVGAETPQADIKLPPFEQGSSFPAADLVREEIQERIEQFLPEVEIEGRQRRREKQLRIMNKTKQTLKVFIHRRTNRFLEEKGYEWIWLPSDPGQHPQVLTVSPGESKLVTADTLKPLTAQRVRIWAENESGTRWKEDRGRDLWLVEENPSFDDERVYFSEKIETFDHTFEPKPGPQEFAERVLRMKNETPESLSVSLEYRTTDDGRAAWHQSQFTIPAGGSYEPKDELGMRIRASRLRFSAESDNRRYETHQVEDLWLVEQTEGQRAYRADEIGEFEYVFLAAASGTNIATVTASTATVKVGKRVVGRVRQGEKYEVLEERGRWSRIAIEQDGKPVKGWVQQKNLQASRPKPKETPGNSRRRFRATSNSADLKIGSSTIARIPPGQEYDILGERSGWLRLEVTLSGETRHGWVKKNDGVVFSRTDSQNESK